ncbi:hypothetical protein COO60DRAFT_1662897 [Scenedesmus sp. NREL 46B-D3]|nr:hypothetical protein COO60DRAFT_1662897 [Scenedesmus sp. NREL 46B-D3]
MLLRCVSCNRQAHLHTSDLLPCTGTCIQGCSLNACRRSVGPPPAHSILILAKTMQLQVLGPQRFNPGVPLSAEMTAIHGITDADVAACPRFEEAAAEWQQFLQGCDLHGYNAKKFDVPILRNEFKRAGVSNFPPLGVTVVDSFRLFCLQEPRSLGAAVSFYCGRSHAGAAHTALADARPPWRCWCSSAGEQLRRYPQLPRDAAGLSALCAAPSRAQDVTGDGKFQWRGETPILACGKHAGEPLAALIARHKDYLRWMSGQDFSDESLILIGHALQGLLPTKAGTWEPLDFGPAPHQQQQQQQRSGGNGGSRRDGRSNGRQGQQEEQQHVAHDAAASCREHEQPPAGGSKDQDNPASSTAAAAVAGTAGWPALGLGNPSAPQQADNADSWAAPTATLAAAAAAEEDEGSGSPGGSNGSPGGWSIVDPAPQDMNPGAVDDLSKREPQAPEQEAGDQEQ